VGLVAIYAAWNLVGAFLPQLTPNDLNVNLLNLSVAPHTGVGNVSLINGRVTIFMGQDEVRIVTTCADGSYDQSPLEKPITMD